MFKSNVSILKLYQYTEQDYKNRILEEVGDLNELINPFICSIPGLIFASLSIIALAIFLNSQIKNMRKYCFMIAVPTMLFINALITMTGPNTFGSDNPLNSVIIAALILALGSFLGIISYFWFNHVPIFLLGFNLSRSVFLFTSCLVNLFLSIFLNASNTNSSIWSPWKKPTWLFIGCYYGFSLIGGFSYYLITASTKGNFLKWFFVKRYRGFISQSFGNSWALILSENCEYILYLCLFGMKVKNIETQLMLESALFLTIYSIGLFLSMKIMIGKDENFLDECEIDVFDYLIKKNLESKGHTTIYQLKNMEILEESTVMENYINDPMLIQDGEDAGKSPIKKNLKQCVFEEDDNKTISLSANTRNLNIIVESSAIDELDKESLAASTIRRKEMSEATQGIDIRDFYYAILSIRNMSHRPGFDSIENTPGVRLKGHGNNTRSEGTLNTELGMNKNKGSISHQRLNNNASNKLLPENINDSILKNSPSNPVLMNNKSNSNLKPSPSIGLLNSVSNAGLRNNFSEKQLAVVDEKIEGNEFENNKNLDFKKKTGKNVNFADESFLSVTEVKESNNNFPNESVIIES